MSVLNDAVRWAGSGGTMLLEDALLPRDPLDNLAASLALSGVAFLIAVLAGKPYIQFLRAHRIGKRIRIDGPEGHQKLREA
jgi:phospho-N-acetylmuramoyl-pentapeptide-transferase